MKNKLHIISPDLYERFISKEREKLLVVTRKHWITILPHLLLLLAFTLLTIAIIISSSFYFSVPTHFVILSFLLSFGISSSICWFTIVSWYYHLYIVTTRKILEYRYIPLFTHNINDVLLDQVRCTEVDIAKNGFIAELFDIGTITVTFDRPTHQEEFVLANIPSPETMGIYLGDALDVKKFDMPRVWHKTDNPSKPFRFTEEIFPGPFSSPSASI
ncbi:MAG: hypothetical protein HY430_00500 [Candidatus Levybacteria bacterium]|nr:hypothetical protein [Candidatus Levybacteria bacterium]